MEGRLSKEAEVAAAKVSEGPSDDPRQWYNTAVGLAIFTGTVGFMAVLYVFWADTPRQSVLRAQIVAPVGVALFALVTFCTVVWRGLLNTQQLEQQAKQLEHQAKQLEHQARQLEYQAVQLQQQIRQNDASDDANLAKLLQEGAKLLGEKEKEAQILGGIVTLEMLIDEPKRKFSLQVMDLLADFYLRAYHNPNLNNARLAARRALAHGHRLGFQSKVRGVLEAKPDGHTIWEGVRGFGSIKYVGGSILNPLIRAHGDTYFWIQKVKAQHCEFNGRQFIDDCEIKESKFREVSFLSMINPGAIIDCDFSNCKFGNIPEEYLLKMKLDAGNFYITGSPPTHEKFKDWSRILTELPAEKKWANHYDFNMPSDIE